MRLKVSLIFILTFLFAMNISAQKKPFDIETLYKVKGVSSPVLSHKGEMIAYTVTSYKLEEGSSSTDIWVMNSDGSDKKQLTRDGGAYGPFWCPKDFGVFFTSYRTGSAQIFFIPVGGGEAMQITDTKLGISSPKLSPDGSTIIFTSKVYPECGADAECNNRIDNAISNGPVQAYMADSLFVSHWTEYNIGKVSHIFAFDMETKNITDLTPGNYNSPTFGPGGNNDYTFSPDGKQIAFASKRVDNPEASTNSDLWVVNLDGTGLVNITKDNKGYDGSAQYSPDGKYIAYKRQATPGYEADQWELTIYNTETREHKILTETIDNMVNHFEWTSNSKSIVFAIDEKGYNPIKSVDIESGKIKSLMYKHSLGSFVLSPDNKTIYYLYSFAHKPYEIAKFDIEKKKMQDLTSVNNELLEEYDFRPAEEIWVDGKDGRRVHAFVIKPHNFDPNKKYPLVVNVHGGPQMQWQNNFRGDWQVYPGAGYVLVYPNPTGSTGYGQDFTLGISKDWDGKVYEDVMSVMDHVENLPYVDKERMGAMGWSYGGYFMNLLQARGNRFKCLASMMGIYDLEQFYLETEELWFTNYDLGGNPWDNPELFKSKSPGNFTQNFETPTLIITGQKDYRISYTQSLRYFTVLQEKEIDSRLIIFKNDGHWPSYTRSMPLYYNSHLEWFNKYLGGAPAPFDSKKLIRNLQFK